MKRTIVLVAVVLMLLPGIGCGPTYYSLSTSVSPSGAGSISPSSGTYGSDTQLTLTATPAPDYVFDYWGGDASGTSPVTSVTMNSDKHVVAHFTTEPETALPRFSVYNLHISPEQVQPNQLVTISVNIANIGDPTGTYTAALYINGQLENSETVSVGLGATREMMFRVSRAQAGTYDVSFAGLEGQFTVIP
jgi:uncharacterized repeat protein (TIGR02543 family)